MSLYKKLMADRFSRQGSPKKRLSGHDPARKKTGATATTLGSTYDFRKNLSTKSATKSATKKKSASVTVGTAGSSKSTKVDLNKKTTSKPKTVDGKTIKHAPPGGWGSSSTTTKPKAPAKAPTKAPSKSTSTATRTTDRKDPDSFRKRPNTQPSGRKKGGAGGRRRGGRRVASKRKGLAGRVASVYAKAMAKKRKAKVKGPNANASDMAKRKTALAHAKKTSTTSTTPKPKQPSTFSSAIKSGNVRNWFNFRGR